MKFQEIIYIRGLKEYVTWCTLKGNIITLNSLSELAKKLKAKGFLQVHKSFIVNLNKVDLKEGNILFLKDEKIPIGKTFKEEVEKHFRSIF